MDIKTHVKRIPKLILTITKLRHSFTLRNGCQALVRNNNHFILRRNTNILTLLNAFRFLTVQIHHSITSKNKKIEATKN